MPKSQIWSKQKRYAEKIAAKEICHTYFKQNGKSAALQINYKEFMTMSKVSQIITETVLKRMEEAEKNGEVFYWVKPFSEGSPNKPYRQVLISA